MRRLGEDVGEAGGGVDLSLPIVDDESSDLFYKQHGTLV